MELAPPDLTSGAEVPIMSVGSDNSVGNRLDFISLLELRLVMGQNLLQECFYMFRNERCKGSSEISGQYVVEDVSVDGEWFRRLIFLHNSSVLQSEAKLKSGTENFNQFV